MRELSKKAIKGKILQRNLLINGYCLCVCVCVSYSKNYLRIGFIVRSIVRILNRPPNIVHIWTLFKRDILTTIEFHSLCEGKPGEWGPWGPCSKSCGTAENPGTKQRSRVCIGRFGPNFCQRPNVSKTN